MEAAGTWSKVSISGSSARSGRERLCGGLGSPSTAPSMTTSRRPRTSAGTHGSSGACSSRAMLVTDSGASPPSRSRS